MPSEQSDLEKRLRDPNVNGWGTATAQASALEAADEIARLRADFLRAANIAELSDRITEAEAAWLEETRKRIEGSS